ncbi:hypothetical protein PIROE2DRAFT_4346, partial [Piromyces sp. E2]
ERNNLPILDNRYVSIDENDNSVNTNPNITINNNNITNIQNNINSNNDNNNSNINNNNYFIRRFIYRPNGNLQYREIEDSGSSLAIDTIRQNNQNDIESSNDNLYDLTIINSYLAQEIEKLLQNEISISQFISEYEAYEILTLLYGNRVSQSSQNLIQQVNQRRIHENSVLYILNQRLRNNIDINDNDFIEESARQMMSEPFDPNNQDSLSLSNLAQSQVQNSDLNRSYYSLGSSTSSSNSSDIVLNQPVEVNISELPINEIDHLNNEESNESNINSPNGELNRNNQNISSMVNFFANSPFQWNSPSMGVSSGNEIPTSRFIRSYRTQYENDFHRYFDENGNLRDEPIREDNYYDNTDINSTSETPLIDYRGRPNIYYEDMNSPTTRRNHPGMSIEMALFCGNSSEVIATILGAESREIRQDLIFSLIRGVLAVRWQQEHDEQLNMYDGRGGREEEEGRRVLYDNNSNHSGEEGELEDNDSNNSEINISRNNAIRASSSLRYRINESINR